MATNLVPVPQELQLCAIIIMEWLEDGLGLGAAWLPEFYLPPMHQSMPCGGHSLGVEEDSCQGATYEGIDCNEAWEVTSSPPYSARCSHDAFEGVSVRGESLGARMREGRFLLDLLKRNELNECWCRGKRP